MKDVWLFTNSALVCTFVSGKAASAVSSPAFVGSPSISVNEFCGRVNVASNAL